MTWDDTIITEKKASDVQRSKKQKAKAYPLKDIQGMLIFEDSNRLVFNKPAGIAMHPGQKHMTDLSLHDIKIAFGISRQS